MSARRPPRSSPCYRGAAAHPDYDLVEEHLRDDELSMIFMCCHPDIPPESRLALSLKTVGGFNVREIAGRSWRTMRPRKNLRGGW